MDLHTPEERPAEAGCATGRHGPEHDASVAAQPSVEDLRELQSAFLTNLHHEMRTPMAGIIGLSDVLDDELDGEPRKFVQLIRESGHRLMGMLESLLASAEIDAGLAGPAAGDAGATGDARTAPAPGPGSTALDRAA